MKHALLGLLAEGPAHGYDLRVGLETGFGGIWESVNSGQVYTTLSRLERDELIEGLAVDEDDGRGKRTYTICEAGRDELRKWLENSSSEPVVGGEVFRKLLVAHRSGLARPADLLEMFRTDTLNRLASVRQARSTTDEADLLMQWIARRLHADLEWIDECALWLEKHTSSG